MAARGHLGVSLFLFGHLKRPRIMQNLLFSNKRCLKPVNKRPLLLHLSERHICGTDTSPALVTALLARCPCCLVLVSVPPKHVEDTIKHQFEQEADYQIFFIFHQSGMER